MFRERESEPESSTSASKSKGKDKTKEEDYDVIVHLVRRVDRPNSASKSRDKGKNKEEDHDVIDHLVREFDSSASASQSKGKGKDKEVDYNMISNPENIKDEIAVIDRQIDALNERKSALQGTELLDKLEKLHKKIHDLAKAVPEDVISTRTQALSRSGANLAGERSRIWNGKPSPNGGTESRELPDWGRAPEYGYYHSRYGNYGASVWGRAPEYGYHY